MNTFELYFKIGMQHIADVRAYDHILFVLALCLRYTFKDWKQVLVLVTAFTIGHSITLALSALNIIQMPTKWVEFFIPVTIAITAFSNVLVKKFVYQNRFNAIYYFALFFGLIHGLGFSNYLKSLLGNSRQIVVELLAFNIGLEVGQLLIVLASLLIAFILLGLLKLNRREYMLFIAGGIFAVAIVMALQRIPF